MASSVIVRLGSHHPRFLPLQRLWRFCSYQCDETFFRADHGLRPDGLSALIDLSVIVNGFISWLRGIDLLRRHERCFCRVALDSLSKSYATLPVRSDCIKSSLLYHTGVHGHVVCSADAIWSLHCPVQVPFLESSRTLLNPDLAVPPQPDGSRQILNKGFSRLATDFTARTVAAAFLKCGAVSL